MKQLIIVIIVGANLLIINNMCAQPKLVIRSDDMGFCHGANVANEQLLQLGIPVNISVIFAGPWYKEAVEILKQHPHASIGVHLCANSEWKNYKWGPISDKSEVPSLVTADGYFHGSYAALNIERTPATAELEREFRAQIERALATGLPIDYVDSHMGAGMHTAEQRAMVERLAAEYGLAISSYFGEQRPGNFIGATEKQQLENLVSLMENLEPDNLYLLVFHLGIDGPEMQAMTDLNQAGAKNMSEDRQRQINMLTSPVFLQALEDYNIQLVTYKQLK